MGIFSNLFKSEGGSNSSAIFSKSELTSLIQTCDDMKQMFASSKSLIASGNGRAQKMASTMVSYKSMLLYFYESILKYGSASQFFKGEDEKNNYELCSLLVFSNQSSGAECFHDAANNWKDIQTVLKTLQMTDEAGIVYKLSNGIQALTSAFDKISKY